MVRSHLSLKENKSSVVIYLYNTGLHELEYAHRRVSCKWSSSIYPCGDEVQNEGAPI